MRRVMIIGQPGSGKSTLARELGAITRLPVYHMDHIHYLPGWVERPKPEKDQLCAEVHASDAWIFEGGRSSTWGERLARADTVIWLDLPLGLRVARVLRRTVRHWGRNRPDLPDGCPERLDPAFLRWIWDTRHRDRAKMLALYERVPEGKARHRLRCAGEVRGYLDGLRQAVARGNLGIPHR